MTNDSENNPVFLFFKNGFRFTLKLKSLLLILAVLVFASPKTFAGSILDAAFNAGVTKGDPVVYVTKPLADGKILVGGSFNEVNNQPTAYLARLNADGSLDATFNSGNAGVNGIIYDIAMQADGKFLIGGRFSSYNGMPQALIARINGDGTLDNSFNSALTGVSANSFVENITVQADGKILVAGQLPDSILRLNADGSIDGTFDSPFSVSFVVREIALQPDGKILAGGDMLGGIVRLNTDGSFDSTFDTTENFGGVYAIKILGDGKILIGGQFGGFISIEPPVARLNTDGSTDSTFSTGAAANFNSAEHFEIQSDGKILVAGTFTNGGIDTLAMLRLNPDGSFDNSFSIPSGNNRSRHVALQTDGKILLGGEFTTLNGQERAGLARLASDGTIDNSFNALLYANALVNVIKQQADGKIVAGGGFNFANGALSNSIARFNTDGSLDTSFNVGTGLIPDYVTCCRVLYDIEIQADGKILLAGVFNGFDGVFRRGIVRLNADGSVDKSFTATIGAGILIVYDTFVQPDGRILASTYGTDPLTGFGYVGVIRLNSDGSDDQQFIVLPDNPVRKIARQSDDKILLGGQFSSINSASAGRIARLNADGSVDSSFNTGIGFNGTVLDIVVQPDGKILVGGTFTSFNGVGRNRVARLNADGSLDTTFDPGSGAETTVWSVGFLPGGKVAVGGNFATFDGASRYRLAILDADGSLDTSIESGLDNNPANTIRSMFAQADGKLVIGGHFKSYDGIPRESIARLLTAQPKNAPFDFDGDGKTDISIFRPAGGEWWYLRSSDNSIPALQFGSSTDRIVPADYTGDGKTDIAVWRETTGEWFVLRSDDYSYYAFPFGSNGDVPAPADYDADGKADAAVFRPSSGTWYINKSTGGVRIEPFGLSGDVPVSADYDGDGKADIAIFRPSSGDWWINRSSEGLFAVNFGSGNDKPVPGDYTGDGKADVAFWRPASGEWFVLRSENASYYAAQFGSAGDVPTAGDYDGDGKMDMAVFRPLNSVWYVNRSTAGLLIQQFGLSTDQPVPSAFVR